MGYMHIPNLYKDQAVLMFKRVFALEKVHGTSAHIRWRGHENCLHPGGETQESMREALERSVEGGMARLGLRAMPEGTIIHGELYGGKCMRMAHAYGPDLRFIAFDVRIKDLWLSVPDAFRLCSDAGIEFVPFIELPADMRLLDEQRDMASIVARRRGIEAAREGIVIRSPIELRKNNDERIIAKHKAAAFAERRNQPSPDNAARMAVLAEANAIADEWATPMRLAHVLQRVRAESMADARAVIGAMIEDIEREAEGEIIPSRAARSAIGRRTAELLWAALNLRLGDGDR